MSVLIPYISLRRTQKNLPPLTRSSQTEEKICWFFSFSPSFSAFVPCCYYNDGNNNISILSHFCNFVSAHKLNIYELSFHLLILSCSKFMVSMQQFTRFTLLPEKKKHSTSFLSPARWKFISTWSVYDAEKREWKKNDDGTAQITSIRALNFNYFVKCRNFDLFNIQHWGI